MACFMQVRYISGMVRSGRPADTPHNPLGSPPSTTPNLREEAACADVKDVNTHRKAVQSPALPHTYPWAQRLDAPANSVYASS